MSWCQRQPHLFSGRRMLFAATVMVVLLPGLAAAQAAPASRVPSVADLVEVVDISGLSASTDGRHVAFRTERASLDRNSYVLTWNIAEIAGGGRLDAGGGAPIYRDPGQVQTEPAFWSQDGRALYFRALVDGAIGIWRFSLDGSSARAVVVEDADVEALRPSPMGMGLDFDLGPSRAEIRRAEEAEYDSGVLIGQSVDLAQNLFRGASINGRMASQRLTGEWFRRSGLLATEPRRHFRLDFATGSVNPLPTPDVPEATPDSVETGGVFAEDGAVAAAREAESGWRVEVRPPGSTEPIVCPPRLCAAGRVDAIAWRPGRRQLLITLADPHQRQTIYLWDVGRGTFRRVAGGEGLLSGGRDLRTPCAITSQFALCVAAGATVPPRLDRIELDSGRRTTIFDPNTALRQRAWPRSEMLRWSVGGQAYAGVLFLPSGPSRRLPLLINYYRCEGFLRGGVGDELPFAPLAQDGFAVLCINTPPFLGPHDARATYRTALAGIRAAIDLLDVRGTVDRRYVGMAGLSFGSEATMWTATHSDLLAAASIASVQFEPAYYWFNAVRGRDHPDILRRSWGLGPPDQDVAGWRELSPALNVSRIRAPLLMQLPEQEARYVIELYARLSNSTTPAELYVFPDEAHIKLQPRHKLAVYRRNRDWFRYWLQAYVDPDPERRDQYQRWQTLRQRRASAGPTLPPASEPQLNRR